MSRAEDMIWHEPDDKIVCLCSIVNPNFDYIRSLSIHITGVAQCSIKYPITKRVTIRLTDRPPMTTTSNVMEYLMIRVRGGWQWQPVGQYADYQKFMMNRNYGVVFEDRVE